MGDPRTRRDEELYTMDEVRRHTKPEDAWLVVDDKVYNISNFWKKHPGGENVIMAYAGMDASAMFHLYHLRKELADKYLKVYEVGKVKPDSIPERNRLIDQDYEELTKKLEKLGVFKANYVFEILSMIHVPMLMYLSYWIVLTLGGGWLPLILSAITLGWAWCQAAYVIHDFGHRAVTHSVPIDSLMQHIYMNLLSGFSTTLVQVYHNLHHTFPHKTGAVLKNVAEGDEGKAKPKMTPLKMLINICTTAPALFPSLWTLASIKTTIQNRLVADAITMSLHFYIYFSAFYPHLGLFKLLVHWVIAKQCWSHIVFFTALANHNEFPPDYEEMTMFEYQVRCTINFTSNVWQDYLTGGQADQIEHHLWPHLPRGRMREATPHVKAMCEKWNIRYHVKPFFKAYIDIFKKLRDNPGASRPIDVWNQMMFRTK